LQALKIQFLEIFGQPSVKEMLALLRVARWFIFRPKIPIRVNFGGPWNGKGWYILWPFGIYHGHLVHFWLFVNLMAICHLFPRFGTLCQEKSGNPGSPIRLYLITYRGTRLDEFLPIG
jgi:hypothetical protein